MNLIFSAGAFADKNVGNGKTVTVSGLSISGGDVGNYSLTQPTTTASITAKELVIGITAEDKVYDGTAVAATSAQILEGLVAGDAVSASSADGLFDDKNVGSDKPVTASVSAPSGGVKLKVCRSRAQCCSRAIPYRRRPRPFLDGGRHTVE